MGKRKEMAITEYNVAGLETLAEYGKSPRVRAAAKEELARRASEDDVELDVASGDELDVVEQANAQLDMIPDSELDAFVERVTSQRREKKARANAEDEKLRKRMLKEQAHAKELKARANEREQMAQQQAKGPRKPVVEKPKHNWIDTAIAIATAEPKAKAPKGAVKTAPWFDMTSVGKAAVAAQEKTAASFGPELDEQTLREIVKVVKSPELRAAAEAALAAKVKPVVVEHELSHAELDKIASLVFERMMRAWAASVTVPAAAAAPAPTQKLSRSEARKARRLARKARQEA